MQLTRDPVTAQILGTARQAPPVRATPARVEPGPRTLSPADRKLRAINLGAVLVPIAGLVAAAAWSWGWGFDWVQFGVSVGLSLATAFGVTVGYHRLFTHKSFRAPAPVRFVLAALGSMAVQGPVIEWAGTHRRHHQHSDGEEDPHSPHMHPDGSWGDGVVGTIKGFYHAHIGWLFAGRSKGLGKYTKDLKADPVVAMVNRQFLFWVGFGLVLPAVLGGVISMSWTGAMLGFLWGGLVRILAVHHITWSVNSICHLWGSSPFRSHDESRNNVLVGLLGMGEGWHNNHHAFPTSARHGLAWWQLDVSYLLIRAMGLVGLASDIRVPDAVRIESKRRVAPASSR